MGLASRAVFLSFCSFFLAAFTIESQAQYPSFPVFDGGGGKINNIQLTGSPAMRTLTNAYVSETVVAYQDATNGNLLTVATTTDGVNFYPHTLGFSIDADPAMAISNNQVYIAYVSSGSIHLISSQDGYNFTSPVTVPHSGTVYNWRPAIADYNGTLYIAYSGTALVYDNSIQGYDYQPYYVLTQATTDGGVHAYYVGSGNPYPVSSYQTGSGPSLVSGTNGDLLLCYLTATYNNPLILGFNGSSWYQFDLNQGGYAQDPEMVVYNGADYIYMRSADSSDHLFAIGATDLFNFTPNGNYYGIELTGVPALAILPSGHLLYAGRTNYPGSGSYLWAYQTSN